MPQDNLALDDMTVLEQTISATPDPTPVADPVDDAPDVQAGIDDAIAAEAGGKPEPQPQADDTVPPQANDVTAKPADVSQAHNDIDLATDDLTVKAINERITSDPQFKAIMERDPAFKNQLFYAARRAERSLAYDELFQTPALAKEIKGAADEFYEFKQDYAENPENALKALFMMTVEKGPDGELARDEAGRYKVSGAYNQAMAIQRGAFYGQISEMVKSIGDQAINGTDITGNDAMEALRILQTIESLLGFGKAPAQPAAVAAPAAGATELPADVQAKLAELEAIKAKNGETQKASFETYATAAKAEANKALEGDIRARLNVLVPANSAMTDYTKNAIIRDVVGEVTKLASANKAHGAMLHRLLQSTAKDPDGAKKVVEFERNYARDIYPRILSRLLSENTKSIVAAASATTKKVDGQLHRKELQTEGGVSAPSRPDAKVQARDLEAKARKEGKRLSDMELLDQLTNV